MRFTPPFHFGSPVGPPHFADRTEELEFLVRHMSRGLNVVVHAPRRYGKTSLLKRAVDTSTAQGVAAGYSNLLRCSSRREVSQAFVRAAFGGPLGGRDRARRLGRLLERIRVRPTVDIRSDGSLSVGFAPGLGEQDWEGALEDVARLLGEEARRRPVALVLDEFQQIAEVDAGLPGTFKAILDDASEVSFVLAGSHVHLMERLTTGAGAPLLNMGELLRLGPVPEDEMVRYLVHRAESAGRPMSEATANLVCTLSGPVPNDIQRLAQEAFDLGDGPIDQAVVERAMDLGTARQAATFSERFERLGAVARRLLVLMASEPLEKPYARTVLAAVEVANDNAVRKALAVLEESELVVRRDGLYCVADPFMRRWLEEG